MSLLYDVSFILSIAIISLVIFFAIILLFVKLSERRLLKKYDGEKDLSKKGREEGSGFGNQRGGLPKPNLNVEGYRSVPLPSPTGTTEENSIVGEASDSRRKKKRAFRFG